LLEQVLENISINSETRARLLLSVWQTRNRLVVAIRSFKLLHVNAMLPAFYKQAQQIKKKRPLELAAREL